jgi:hypothetical protein
MSKRLSGRAAGVAIAMSLASCLMPVGAQAWGPDGHKIVCQIAWDQLSQHAKDAIDQARQGDNMTKYPTFAESCVWADDIRSDHAFDWAKPLHFLDVPKNGNDNAPVDSCPAAGCVTSAIDRFSAVLKDTSASAEDKLQALKFVGHFVGDLQQPLHLGHAKDLGGNSIHVFFFGTKVKLHSLWDSGLIAHEFTVHGRDWHALATALEGQISESEKSEWAAGAPADWAVDTHRLALSNAYKGAHEGAHFANAYYSRNIQVVYTQLQKGGVRLAEILEGIYGGQ